MIEQIVRPYIPVNSFVREPVVITEAPPEPDIGIRWGKPSRFVHSNQGKKPKRRPLVSSGADDEEEEELEEESQIIKLTGDAFKYVVETKEGSAIQMTSQLVFEGRRMVERYDSQGRRQMPATQNIKYIFNLTLNGDQ